MIRNVIFYVIIFLVFGCSKENLLQTPSFQKGAIIFDYQNIENDTLNASQRIYDEQIDLYFTGWGVYEDIIFPGTSIEWSMNHQTNNSTNTKTLHCAIIGGDQYNNVFFTNTKALKWQGEPWQYQEAKYLVYELDLYIDGELDCANPDEATIEGVELTWQHIALPFSHGFGVQFSKSGEWRFWNNEQGVDEKPIGWESFSPKINQCLSPKKWHSIKLESYITENSIVYKSMTIDNQEFDLQNTILPYVKAKDGWVENFIQIGMQINGNKSVKSTTGVDAVAVILDNVHFKGYQLLHE